MTPLPDTKQMRLGQALQNYTEKAKKAGFDGIKIMGETVIFDPKNIRKPKAKFDIKKSDSDDLLSAMPQSLLDTNATV
ncbi:hypothetical protein [uncultured Mediterranean phage uvMED]|nr:hypothetical protein [uncultured Mediterranean phage uvMED]